MQKCERYKGIKNPEKKFTRSLLEEICFYEVVIPKGTFHFQEPCPNFVMRSQ